jgi:hypothetical protein
MAKTLIPGIKRLESVREEGWELPFTGRSVDGNLRPTVAIQPKFLDGDYVLEAVIPG